MEDDEEEVEDDEEEVEDDEEEVEDDEEEVEENEEVVEDNDLQTKKVALHFIDCIIQDEQKADANVVLSCLEAAMHAIRRRFPYLTKVIVQSDNAKNLAGKQTKLLLPHVCSAAGLKLVAYYHNEAQSGKDVCDTLLSSANSSQCLPGAGRWWKEDFYTQAACCSSDDHLS